MHTGKTRHRLYGGAGAVHSGNNDSFREVILEAKE